MSDQRHFFGGCNTWDEIQSDNRSFTMLYAASEKWF
jgi:hypothetical protein